MTRLFTYGDRIRRKSGGAVHTVIDISDTVYNFADGTFAIISDQDCYEIVEKASGFFRVATMAGPDIIDSHLHHGYEYSDVFAAAVARLIDYWGGRTGENVGERNKFLLLRFHDTPGGVPDEAWLPIFLLTPTAKPDYIQDSDPSSSEAIRDELDAAFGFD